PLGGRRRQESRYARPSPASGRGWRMAPQVKCPRQRVGPFADPLFKSPRRRMKRQPILRLQKASLTPANVGLGADLGLRQRQRRSDTGCQIKSNGMDAPFLNRHRDAKVEL